MSKTLTRISFYSCFSKFFVIRGGKRLDRIKRRRKKVECLQVEQVDSFRVGSIVFIAAIRRLESECRRSRGRRGDDARAGKAGVQNGVVGTIGGRRYR